MSEHQRRQHFRIEDDIYFDYKVLEPGNCYTDKSIAEDLLGQSEPRYSDTAQYFQDIDHELQNLTQILARQNPTLAHCINLMNSKIDFLVRHFSISKKVQSRRVTLSLGGMSFQTKEKIKEKTYLKMVVYTKPKIVPILVNAFVVYSQLLETSQYRTAIQFENLTREQEQLLSQHIMHAQVSNKTNCQ